MGAPIARRLIDAGHEVSLYNRSRSAMVPLLDGGAQERTSAADLIGQADVVLTALPTVDAVRSVYAEAVSVARAGQLFIDHSTSPVELTQDIGRDVADAGAGFLDAPVSGGPGGAQAGTLTVMVGGEQSVFDRAAPVFAAYGGTVRLCGATGSGQVMKLVNQLLVAIHTAASAEAAALATRLGADLEMVGELIGASFGGSVMLLRNLPRFAQADFSPATPVELIAKDLAIIRAEADTAGLTLELADAVRPLYDGAVNLGWGKEDMSVLFRRVTEANPAHDPG